MNYLVTLLICCFLFSFQSYANLNFGAAMNNSTMDIPPIVTNSDNEYTFRKNSISLYGQKSILHNTLVFTGRTEIIDISRDSMVVNGTILPVQKNQGIRSVELNAMQYLYTVRSWRYHGQLGYNIKGMQGDGELKFAIPNDEYGFGLIMIKAKKMRGVITPIMNGIMNITDVPLKKVDIGMYFGKGYLFYEGSVLLINPISKKISLKLFGKLKRYNINQGAPVFINEERAMGGVIFKSQNHHSIEFNLYHDFISKEFGSSVGINYFLEGRVDDTEHRVLNHYETKYVKKDKKAKGVEEKKKEMEQMVNDILEERGL